MEGLARAQSPFQSRDRQGAGLRAAGARPQTPLGPR